MSDSQKEIHDYHRSKMTEDYKTAWADFENEVLADAEAAGVELVRDVDMCRFPGGLPSIYDKPPDQHSPAVYSYVGASGCRLRKELKH